MLKSCVQFYTRREKFLQLSRKRYKLPVYIFTHLTKVCNQTLEFTKLISKLVNFLVQNGVILLWYLNIFRLKWIRRCWGMSSLVWNFSKNLVGNTLEKSYFIETEIWVDGMTMRFVLEFNTTRQKDLDVCWYLPFVWTVFTRALRVITEEDVFKTQMISGSGKSVMKSSDVSYIWACAGINHIGAC